MSEREHGPLIARSVLHVVLLFLLLSLASWMVAAAPGMSVTLGVGGHVVRDTFSPIWIELSAFDEAVDGEIVVDQLLGSRLDGTEDVSHVIYAGPLSDGIYEATIPVVYPLNPARVVVRAVDGTVLIEEEVSLRLSRREGPFPLVCGALIDLGGEDVHVEARELPRDWWGLQGVRTIWLGGETSLANENWRSILEWTQAGGGTVLLTGADFFRMDSPELRELLPIREPVLEATESGGTWLAGVLRAGADVLWERDGLPYLVRMPYGAGHVLLVAEESSEIDPQELERIISAAPHASLLSTLRLSGEALGEMDVVRPSFWNVPILVVGLAFGFVIAARMRPGRPRLAIALLIVFVGGLSVWSGFMSNPSDRVVDLYISRTRFAIQAAFGMYIDCYSLYATQGREVTLAHEDGHFPKHVMEQTVEGPSFELRGEGGASRFTLQVRERRDMEGFGRGTGLTTFQLGDRSLTVTHRGREPVEGAVAIIFNEVHELPMIEPGEQTIQLAEGTKTHRYYAGGTIIDRVIDLYADRLSLEDSVWMVIADTTERVERTGSYGRKVSETTIHLILGESS